MKRPAKKAAKKGGPPVIDPYLPNNGNFGYRVSRYELELEYKVAINRLTGAATITAATLASLKTFTLDLSDALAVTKVTVNGRRPAQFRDLRRQAAHHPVRATARRGGDVHPCALRRISPADPKSLGRSRFRGAVQRRAGRRAAERGGVMVSLRRPSQRQGQLPHPDQHRQPVSRGGQRRAGVAAGSRRAHGVDL